MCEALRIASSVYSGALCLAGIFFNAIWQHALNARLVDPHADAHRLYALRWHWRLVPIFYTVALVFALFNVYLALAMYVVLLFYYALPGPALVRWGTARRRDVHAGRARS